MTALRLDEMKRQAMVNENRAAGKASAENHCSSQAMAQDKCINEEESIDDEKQE